MGSPISAVLMLGSGAIAGSSGARQAALLGVIWMVSGAGGQTLLRLVFLLVLARLLGPEAFGMVGAAIIVINITKMLSSLGVATFLVQTKNLSTIDVRTCFTILLISGVLVTGLVQVSAPMIEAFFGFEGLALVLQFLGLMPLIANVGIVAEGLVRRRLAFRWLSITSLATFAVAYGCVGVPLAFVGAGLWALVAAQLLQTGLWTIALVVYQRHEMIPMVKAHSLSKLAHFSVGVTGWRSSGTIAQNVDNIVVGRFLGAEALGLYGRAYQMTSMPLAFLGNAVVGVITPILSKFDDKQRLGVAFRDSLEVMSMVTMPMSVVIAIIAPEVVQCVLGDGWLGVTPPLQVLAAGIFFRMSFRLTDALGVAQGAVYTLAWREFVYAAAVTVGALLGQQFGVTGVAFGVLAALLLNFGLAMAQSMRLTGLNARDLGLAHARAVMLSALIGAVLYALVGACRQSELPDFVVLIAAVGVLAVAGFAVVRYRDGVLIGPQGRWLVITLLHRCPGRRNLLPNIVGLERLRQRGGMCSRVAREGRYADALAEIPSMRGEGMALRPRWRASSQNPDGTPR